jgi:predicted DNA-binding protein (MmcQ/YjbR family)
MNIEELRNYCLSKKGSEECFPFDEQTLVFKVMGKIFLLSDINSKPLEFNAKCEPDLAVTLREKYSNVKPGYHMSKRHWNTITCNDSLPDRLIKEWIDHSYQMVVNGLSAKLKAELELL